MHSIDSFWLPRLSSVVRSNQAAIALAGWHADCTRGDSYIEARLGARGEPDLSSSVWLIAASGAVGKSTLAKEICAATGAIYVDLATSSTVAGNYVVGGLVKNQLWDAWQAERTTVLIDALDEARLRVTQSSFEDFLLDVAGAAKGRSLPLILLGRVGIVNEAREILRDRARLECPVFDIELFDSAQAERFVMATLRRLSHAQAQYPQLGRSLQAHPKTYQEAARDLVAGLEAATSKDGRQFSGYAPVLEAVAKVIAGESNPSQINDATKLVLQGQILERVTEEIMRREAKKLAEQLAVTVPGLATDDLYSSDEQLSRLSARLFYPGAPAYPVQIPARAAAAYQQAVDSLLPQHPFLDGTGVQSSGAVFAACIAAHALQSSLGGMAAAAERYARGGAHAPNPFLLDFYRSALGGKTHIPADHVGFLYESVQAKAEVGDVPRLDVAFADEEGRATVEISVERQHGTALEYEFTIKSDGTLKFGRRVSSVSVDAPDMEIEIGDGQQLEMVAPVALTGRSIMFLCEELVVKANADQEHDSTVVLEAAEMLADSAIAPPTVRNGVTLQVLWPDAQAYPWTRFASQAPEDPDPAVAEALRSLRRLIISFRSHSKGQLARYKGKVEHVRMTKGRLGDALRERLLGEKILTLEGTMYILDPDALGRIAGVSFGDIKLKRYGEQVKTFLRGLGQ